MEDQFDKLKNTWEAAKKEHIPMDSHTMLTTILKNHSNAKKSHLMNGLVLFITVLGLITFFYFLAPMQDTLSRTGIGLMIGGLLVRILIELISHQKAQKIDYATNSSKTALQAEVFYAYRKRIHGPVTLLIVALYTIGFYALMPEFSRYLSNFSLWLWAGSYVPIGLALFWGIRKGVVREMQDLKRIIELQNALRAS